MIICLIPATKELILCGLYKENLHTDKSDSGVLLVLFFVVGTFLEKANLSSFRTARLCKHKFLF